jgi:hypothetical protein
MPLSPAEAVEPERTSRKREWIKTGIEQGRRMRADAEALGIDAKEVVRRDLEQEAAKFAERYLLVPLPWRMNRPPVVKARCGARARGAGRPRVRRGHRRRTTATRDGPSDSAEGDGDQPPPADPYLLDRPSAGVVA